MPGPNEADIQIVPVDGQPTTPEPGEKKTNQAAHIELPARESVPAPLVSGVESRVLEPKTETLRAGVAADSKQPAAQMKDTDSLTGTPAVALGNGSAVVAPETENSMFLWWILLGLSALILIIQIWTYFS